MGGKTSVAKLQRAIFLGTLVAVVVLVAGWSALGFDRSGAAIAAQGSPVPTVSVTTLPAMPGGAATQTPAAQATAIQATQGSANPWTQPIAPPLGVSYIQVVGDVTNPITLTLKDLEKMKPASLTLRFHTYTGVPLIDVLN